MTEGKNNKKKTFITLAIILLVAGVFAVLWIYVIQPLLDSITSGGNYNYSEDGGLNTRDDFLATNKLTAEEVGILSKSYGDKMINLIFNYEDPMPESQYYFLNENTAGGWYKSQSSWQSVVEGKVEGIGPMKNEYIIAGVKYHPGAVLETFDYVGGTPGSSLQNALLAQFEEFKEQL